MHRLGEEMERDQFAKVMRAMGSSTHDFERMFGMKPDDPLFD